jgi:hypothetical protein
MGTARISTRLRGTTFEKTSHFYEDGCFFLGGGGCFSGTVVEVCRRFRGACRRQHQVDGGRKHF